MTPSDVSFVFYVSSLVFVCLKIKTLQVMSPVFSITFGILDLET